MKSTIKWTRRDLGDNSLINVVTEVETVGSTNFVSIGIPLKAYQRLVNWASVGRTIDALLSANEENREIGREELEKLREIFDAIQASCRSHYLIKDERFMA